MPKDEKGREIPSRFYIGEGNLIFSKAVPLTEEKRAEAEAMWEAMTNGNYSPEKKKDKNPKRKDLIKGRG